MTGESTVRAAFADQSGWCEKLGSPFTARLMAGLGEGLDRSTRTGQAVLDWQGIVDARGDAVPLRLAGALHALVRRGQLPELAGLYPPNPLPAGDVLSEAALGAIAAEDDEICRWLTHPPQTNEVARSAVLFPGLMVVAAETGLPIVLCEVGSSAGLNLNLDRYECRLNGTVAGEEGSPLVLSPEWTGPAPPGSSPTIVSRRGCDRNPLDVTDERDRERVVAYVWPDQADRIARVEAAIEIARRHPPPIDRADAGDWVEDTLRRPPASGTVRVLMHSIAFQYFPEAVKDRITSAMEEVGSAATPDAPLAWLSFEQRGEKGVSLELRLWPGGAERTLALADAHGRSVNWRRPSGDGGAL